jgi:hypothetical protein
MCRIRMATALSQKSSSFQNSAGEGKLSPVQNEDEN